MRKPTCVHINDGGYSAYFITSDGDPKSGELEEIIDTSAMPKADGTVGITIKRAGSHIVDYNDYIDAGVAALDLGILLIAPFIGIPTAITFAVGCINIAANIIALTGIDPLPVKVADRYAVQYTWTTSQNPVGYPSIIEQTSHKLIEYYAWWSDTQSWEHVGSEYSFSVTHHIKGR